ncbi:MAG: MBL fold metallo-hydrolase [Candidatus Calescibacterium sp.]|nr:MBL fold metallo-hydrolase [Candidatus Calescibacterium sp.]MCX7734055.1 MBL fold metallo-hydrolase [bacterium]MDW8087050.1 MBL fold metallo-hydrolase [Candidatus Calescibacterium sp.]
MKIEVLGAFGSKLKNLGMTSILINDKVSIDAGNIVRKGEKIFQLEHIVLTHQHLDHIADIPYLIAESFPVRKNPLKIYTHTKALESISRHILNTEIWPDFSSIKMIDREDSSLRYEKISLGQEINIDGLKITPFESNHTVLTFGYKVYDQKSNCAFLITGDTWKQDNVWEIANSDPDVKAIFVDVSYPKRMRELGKISKHLSSDVFEEELYKLKRKDLKIYVYHIKPAFRKEVIDEISEIKKRTKFKIEILKDGMTFEI